MRTESTPRGLSPGLPSVPAPANAPTTPAAVGSARSDFSTGRPPPRMQADGNASAAGDPPQVREHAGAPLFGTRYSISFGRALQSAQHALWSADNLEHFDINGRLSPTACKALYRLVSVVALKSSEDHASVAARWAFREDKLTPEETRAWMDFAGRLPASFLSEATPASSWRSPDETELAAALSQDSAFALFLGQPAGQQFVKELADAIRWRSAEMKPSDRGMAITMQFAHAYGVVNHIAGGSFWRDAQGRLQMQLIHQESFPPTQSTGNIAVGRVYDRLDTSADHPERRSTMVESMKLAGLPSVNLFPCAAPELLVPFTELLMAVGFHPYGPTQDWNNGNRGSVPAQRAFECCFDVTARALHVMNHLMAPRVHLLPDNIERMQHHASIAPGQFDEVSIDAGKGQRTVRVKAMGQLGFREQYAVFKEVGSQWGRIAPWDVGRQTDSQILKLPLHPGQQGIALRPEQRFKFIDRVPGLMLDGTRVGPERAYTAEEAQRMTYAGDKPLDATVVVTSPRGQMQARL